MEIWGSRPFSPINGEQIGSSVDFEKVWKLHQIYLVISALFNHICCRTLHAQLFFSQRLNFWHSTSCSPCSRSRKVLQGLRQKTERIPAGFLFSYSSLGDHGLRSPSPLLQCILQTLVSRCLKLLNRNIPGQEKKISFYRTQVSLGSGLWVPVYLPTYIQELCETLLMWLWLMMIPTQNDWWCQFKAIPCNS